MIAHTAAQLEALRNGPSVAYLIKKQIGSTLYHLTNKDIEIEYDTDTYLPGFIQSIDDIEVTSEPRTNTISIELGTHDNTFVPLYLGGEFRNKPLTIFKHFYNADGPILTKNVFKGLLTNYSQDVENDTLTISVESVWADFEKQTGIKTNVDSHQRFYPSDTGFRHVVPSSKKIYWGVLAPGNGSTSGSGGGGAIPRTEPDQEP